MKTNELEIDHHVAQGIACLTKQGVTVEYDAVTGELHVTGQEGRARTALMQVLTEKLAASLVTSHQLTEEIRRCLRNN